MFAYAFMQFFFSPIIGGLSDRYGRRPVLLLSLFGFGLDYIFLALAPTITWLFVGRILAGIFGASVTTAMAYIADISKYIAKIIIPICGLDIPFLHILHSTFVDFFFSIL